MAKQYGSDPATSAFTITPNDTTDLDQVTRAVIAGTSGTITVDMLDTGTNITFAIVAGIPLAIRVKRVYASGTTVTGIVGLF